jgi:hypothetical protein
MCHEDKITAESRFPSLQPEMLNRISQEAELRTLRPQLVDWVEIHKLAAEARGGDN